jgi:hypothetical protein
VFGAVFDPAQLVVLQAVAGAFYFDHVVAALGRPELNQVGEAAAVGLDVCRMRSKARFRCSGGMQSSASSSSGIDRLPVQERRLDAVLGRVVGADGGAVLFAIELRQRILKLLRAAALEIGAVQIGRAAMVGMEEGARNRRNTASQHSRPNSELISAFST